MGTVILNFIHRIININASLDSKSNTFGFNVINLQCKQQK